jgi:SMI1 / KNR4 family (SUKH-1)
MNAEQFQRELDWFCTGLNSAKGCRSSRIATFEKRYGVRLPDDYRAFLTKCGNGVQGLWVGSDYTVDALDEMQDAGSELLADAGLSLPENAFVCWMHQGYQFMFVCPDGICYFLEGNEAFAKQYDSFADFFVATCRKW